MAGRGPTYEAVAAGLFKAAAVQMRSGISLETNLADATSLIEDAAAQGAQFIATPEMTTVLDQNPKRLFSTIQLEDQTTAIAHFAALAKRLGVWVLIGSMAIKLEDRRAANRAYLFAPDGTIAARYDKQHMFDVSLENGESWRESSVYEAGRDAVMATIDTAKIGITICYDLRFPDLYQTMARAGAQMFCIGAAFTRQTGKVHWHALMRARAIENGAFVIAPAQGGQHEDGRETYGHSLIIDPWGRISAELDTDEPGVILADIDFTAVQKARQSIPNLGLEPSYKILNVTV